MIITQDDPRNDDLDLIFARHTEAMHADTPPESIHMMDRGDLARDGIAFFVLRHEGRAVGMGAVKPLIKNGAAPCAGEIKSMHILSEYRGQGFAKALLLHLIDDAQANGWEQLYLETGAQDSFAAARALYLRAGFVECPPFAGYGPDPNSVFMVKRLEPAARLSQEDSRVAP